MMAGDRPNRRKLWGHTPTHISTFLSYAFKSDNKTGLFQKSLLWHTDLDEGDMEKGSIAWHVLQRYDCLVPGLAWGHRCKECCILVLYKG